MSTLSYVPKGRRSCPSFFRSLRCEPLDRMTGPARLVASLLYEAGLRLLECLTLRVKDLDFDRNEISVRDGKDRPRPIIIKCAAAYLVYTHVLNKRGLGVRSPLDTLERAYAKLHARSSFSLPSLLDA